jgi:endo-1,4-beta-xylanase
MGLKMATMFRIMFTVLVMFTCIFDSQAQKKVQPGLKDVYKGHFYIGAALSQERILGEDPAAMKVVLKEFNSITPENVMKWQIIHPFDDEYDFRVADEFVKLGEKDSMFIVGHTLVWHSQLPDWVHELKDSAALFKAMKDHIYTVAGRYKGRVKGWDVVNEALEEDGTLRKSNFLTVAGESYIQKAFEFAAQADPKAELYYNDYNIDIPVKRDGAIRLIKNLQSKGVKIDGVGIQGHWSLTYPSIQEIEDAIVKFSELGIKVMFTEVDVTVLPNPWDLKGADVNQNFEGGDKMNPYPGGLSDQMQAKLAERYAAIFKLFEKHKDKISRVTFWGVDDGHSWLNNWPIQNRTNYPLLFDRSYKPKPAYNAVINVIKQ